MANEKIQQCNTSIEDESCNESMMATDESLARNRNLSAVDKGKLSYEGQAEKEMTLDFSAFNTPRVIEAVSGRRSISKTCFVLETWYPASLLCQLIIRSKGKQK
jgi:hypothetical protein